MPKNKKKKKLRLTEKLFNEQKGLCFYCGYSMEGVRFNIEHLIPDSRGGSGRESNVVLVHEICNWILADFVSIAEVEEYTNVLKKFISLKEKELEKRLLIPQGEHGLLKILKHSGIIAP